MYSYILIIKMLNSTITPENYIDDWPYIPKEAFLYFPSRTYFAKLRIINS